MDQLKHTCFEFTTTICSALIECDKDSIGTLKLLLQCAVQTILKQQQCDGNTFSKTLPPTVLQTSQSIIAATSSAPFPAAAKHIFYSQHQFPQLADVLLTFIAPTYLDTFFSQSEKDDLFYVWFRQAPPLSLLLTLSDQLTMDIGYINTSRSSTRITTAAGEFTSQLLESYFSSLPPSPSSSSSSFIQDIITQLSESNTTTTVDENEEKLSIALSSLLDKAAPYYDTCPSLQPATFIPTIITNLLHIDNNNNNDTTTCRSLKVLSDLMTRLSRRGHVAIVATTLITAVQQQHEGNKEKNRVNVQQCIKMAEDSHGLGILLLSMITQSSSSSSSSSSVPILPLVLPRSTWIERTDVQQLTTNTWLGHFTLHPTAINQILDYLHHISDSGDQVLLLLPGIVTRLAAVWGDVSGTIQVMSLRQQACITYTIVQCLKRMNKQQVEQYPRLLMNVLSGVSARLESPLIVVKKQGMRVGDALSLVLEPGKKPLFYDDDDNTGDNSSSNSSDDDVVVIIGCPEEQWWSEATCTGEADNGKTTIKKKKKEKETVKEKMPPGKDRNVSRKNNKIEEQEQGSGGVLTETDSDDDGIISIASSDSEFEQYDISDSDSDDDGNDDGGKHSHIQLRDLPKMLTRGVDGKDTQGWKDQILALRLTESLVRASPDELPMHAESLAKALLYAQLPKWLDEEMKPGSGLSTVEGQRYKNMVALLTEVPEQAGLTIASHVYSPSLDMHQRVLALSALSTAAEELAHPGKHLAITTRKQQCEGDEGRRRRVSSGMTVDGQQRIGRVTWMAQQTLANLQQQQEMMRIGSNSNSSSQYVPTSINKFPSVALKWAAALLKECDVQKHGVDLFGRDAYLLGKLLTTLGTFIECCSGTTSAQPLALATMELLHNPRIHDHPEPFVRRAALLSAGHVVSQGVPPSLLASAALLLSSSSSSSSRGTNNISSTIIAYSTTTDLTITTGIDDITATEETAVRLLHWLMQWVDSVADKDSDETCIKMGVSVKNLSSQIAAQVLIGDKEGYIKNHEVRITGLGDKGVLSIKGPTVSKIPR
jgi:hypothetical protein